MRLIVTNYSSAVDLGVMLGRVAICFKAGQDDYGKQCTRGVRRMKWNLPQNNEVAIIDLRPESTQPADVVLHLHGGNIQHISENHRSFEALHYTLLFPHGDDGSVI